MRCNDKGCSQCYMAHRLNVHRSTVQRTWQRYRETGFVKRRTNSGRKPYTEPRDDHFLVSQALRNRKSSYVDLKKILEEVRDVEISIWTVRRRLLAANIRTHRPARGPKIQKYYYVSTEFPGLASLEWTEEEWNRLLFSDEARYLCTVKTNVGECYEDKENALQRHVLKKSHLMLGALLCFGQE